MNRLQALGLAGGLIIISVVTILHNPVGGYLRDDGLYSKAQFMRMVREAFPEYSDLSDSDVLARFLTTYPAFKTWIREETDGSPPLAVAIRGQPTNYRLTPPPAYYGIAGGTYSRYAAFVWIDEPAEYIGIVLPIILATVFWIWLLRRRSSQFS